MTQHDSVDPTPPQSWSTAKHDAEAVRRELSRGLPQELSHLPFTSAAEFRAAAWPMRRYIPPEPITFYGRAGIRGYLAIFTGSFAALSLPGLFVLSTSWGDLLEGLLWFLGFAAATFLLLWSRHRSKVKQRDGEYINLVLVDLSRKVDRAVAQGRIPERPPGWRGPVPSSLP